MMRTAAFSSAPIFGGLRRLLRRFGAVLFGIGAIREEAQRNLVQPCRDAIGRRSDLAIAKHGPWKRPAATRDARPATRDARSVYYGSLDGTLSAIQSPSYLRGGLVLFSQLRQHCPVDQADVRN